MALRWLKKDPSATPKPATPKTPEPHREPLPSEDPQTQAETLTPDTTAAASTPPPGETAPAKNGFFKRLKRGLAKTRSFLTTDLENLFAGKHRLDDELLEEPSCVRKYWP